MNEKLCEACGEEFIPETANQRFCQECEEDTYDEEIESDMSGTTGGER